MENVIRKTIDISQDTKRALSYQAIKHGVSLKKYIENVLVHLAEAEEDERLIELSQDTGGTLQGREKTDFFSYLRSLQ
jgi:hypothetical protein